MVILIAFASCASAPRVSIPAPGEESLLLPTGGNVYIVADAITGRPLLDLLSPVDLNHPDIASMIDRTDTMAAALYPASSDRNFFLAALGTFPGTSANFSFLFSRGWRRQSSAGSGSYWFSREENIAISLSSNLIRVSNTDPIANFQTERPPPGLAEFGRGMPLIGWMPSPADFLNGFFTFLGIPIQIPAEEFFFSASQPWPDEDEYWELLFRIKTPSELHARSILALFTVARLAVFQGMVPSEDFISGISINPREFASLLLANLPERDVDILLLRTNPMTARQMALLFNMFTLY
ncbi:MAG: hypothetical protein FWG77_06610 [Treponema sp.]|nr:hypothetical protein [Treponema sp.]